MKIDDLQLLKRIIEGVLMAAEKPLSKAAIKELFDDLERPNNALIDEALEQLAADCESRGYELKQVASGFRFQVSQDLSKWVSKLWKERAPRYSRALLETLSLIAYRQPITRGEIESIRGVAVSSHIIRTLLEREWVKAVGHRDVPGRPAIYATTREFLDYFNLKSLDQLPPLAEIRDLNAISRELNIELPLEEPTSANDEQLEDSANEVADGDVDRTESNDESVSESELSDSQTTGAEQPENTNVEPTDAMQSNALSEFEVLGQEVVPDNEQPLVDAESSVDEEPLANEEPLTNMAMNTESQNAEIEHQGEAATFDAWIESGLTDKTSIAES